jgi:2-polyprenyl-3-methyl-5-hydroxy-6-metoxy-1,4-benzoquinol methylase
MTAFDRFIQRYRIRKASAFIRPGDSVLDIGTADGTLFRMIPNLGDSVGVDPDLNGSLLPQLPNVSFYAGFFPEALPKPLQFDVITMLAVLEHVPSNAQSNLAQSCKDYLRPGGILVITVPSPMVDHFLAVLKLLRLIDGMSLEQHYGFKVDETPSIFGSHGLSLTTRKRFQLGLNNLFVFKRPEAQYTNLAT